MRKGLKELDEMHGQLDESNEDWSLMVSAWTRRVSKTNRRVSRVFLTFGQAWTRRVVWKLDESTWDFMISKVLERLDESVSCTQ